MKLITNKWTILLAGIFIVFSLMIMTQCSTHSSKSPKWRYEIRGHVIYKGEKHEAVWFTDSLELGDNYVSYTNSDGSEVVIPAPFILIDHKYDKVVEDTKPAFQ